MNANDIDFILVSVVIPVYNAAEFVDECIKSVINQSHRNLDIILINDGSKDNSADICRKYLSDSRIRLIDRENHGLSHTRQEGIENAKGDFLCTLDADDCFDLQFVEKMLKRIIESNSDVCVCERIDFEENRSVRIPLPNTKDFYVLNQDILTSELLSLSKELLLSDSWNKMYRISFIRDTKVEFFLPNKFNGTDLAFNHLLILHCPIIAIVKEPLLLHRFVQGSRVHRKGIPFQKGFHLIFNRLVVESKVLHYKDDFFDVLGKLYYSYAVMAFKNLLLEIDDYKTGKSSILLFFENEDSFYKENYSIKGKYIKKTSNSAVASFLIFRALFKRDLFACKLILMLLKAKR